MYDNEGNICGIRYYGELWFFQKNLQGDIIAIKNQKGEIVARYRYDAWGVPTIVEDISTNDEDWEGDGIATVNPFRYRGYYYDNETGLYYLQSRYYDPNVGRFVNADSPELCALSEIMPCGGNLYSYCLNNPILGYDADGCYDRSAAVYYALKWYNKRNRSFYYYNRGDCANFVSQCLNAGGIRMNKEWHSYKKRWIKRSPFFGSYYYLTGVDWDVTATWRGAISQHNYFCRTRFKNGNVIVVKSGDDIKSAIKRGLNIQKGDLLHFLKKNKSGKTEVHHAAIIVEVSYRLGKIYYAGHTNSVWRKDLSTVFNTEDKVYITRLRDYAS